MKKGYGARGSTWKERRWWGKPRFARRYWCQVFLLQTNKTLHHSGNSPGIGMYQTHSQCHRQNPVPTNFPAFLYPHFGTRAGHFPIRNSTPNDLTARPTADHRSTPRPVTLHRPRHWPISRDGRDTGVWFGRSHQSGFQNLSVLWLKIKKMNEKKE